MDKICLPGFFNYTDHVKLLKDLYIHTKSQNRHFSYRYFSQQAGYSSPSALKDVIEGRKKVPVKKIAKFLGPFHLTQTQQEYFILLTQYNLAVKKEDKRTLFRELIRFRRPPRQRQIERKEYGFYNKWYYGAIRELAGLRDFKADPEWIAGKLHPGITAAQAKEAMAVLLKLGFLKKRKGGRVVQDVPKLTIDPETRIKALKDLTRQMLELEWAAIEDYDARERERLGLTMHMSRRCYEDIRKMMRQYQETILNYVSRHPDKSDMVCHMGLSVFPLICPDKKGIKS